MHTFLISDANNCNGEVEFLVEGNNIPDLTINSSPTCDGDQIGKIYITAFDPIDSDKRFNFNWSTNASTSSSWFSEINNLAAGNYTVSISNENGHCEIVRTITVEELTETPPTIESEIEHVACVESATGSITLSLAGGNPPFNFLWQDRSTRSSRHQLSPGNYCVTITDYCGFTNSECFELQIANLPISLDAEIQAGNDLGAIYLRASGGDGLYTYQWSNGASSKNLLEVQSGTYTVTVTDSAGCSRKKSFTLSNCETNPQTPLSIEVLFGESRIDPGSGHTGSCQGYEFLRITTIEGGKPPYLIKIKSANPNSPFTPITKTQSTPVSGSPFHPAFNLPKGRYIVNVYDKCGNRQQDEVDLCAYCGFEYEEAVDVYTLSEGGIKLDLDCACLAECGGRNPKMEVKINDLKFDRRNAYTITWPDQSTSTIAYINNPNYTGIRVTGPKIYEFTNTAAPTQIIVTRDDGCIIYIPISFSQQGAGVVVFTETQWGDLEGQYYGGTLGCNACVIDPAYYTARQFNRDGFNCVNKDPALFTYFPYDYDNPCAGGGRLLGHKLENGVPIIHTFIIPPNINIPTFGSSGPGAVGNGDLMNGLECDVNTDGFSAHAGACVFDALDVYGFSLDKYLLAQYCTSYRNALNDPDGDNIPNNGEDNCPDLYDPTNNCLDEDGNGIPDVDTEELCVETIEVPYDGGCDLDVFCVYENGTKSLLHTLDGPNVVPCKFIVNGSCHSIRAFCISDCQFEVLEQNGTGTTYNNLDCSMNLPTCDQIAESYNCLIGNNEPEDRQHPIKQQIEKAKAPVFEVYPNPFIDNISIAASNLQQSTTLNISLINSIGQHIFSQKITFGNGNSITAINGLKKFPSGFYTLVINDKKQLYLTHKLIKINQ